MNLAVHGLEGDIREGISYYDDLHTATGRFDFVLANPPFNVNAVDKERLEGDVGKGRRLPFGLPRSDNANYLWIQLFWSALNDHGRAGFVMANSAADARSSELEIRRQLDGGPRRVVVVGAGFIGSEVASTCTALGHDVTVLEALPAPLSRGVGQDDVTEIVKSASSARKYLVEGGFITKTGKLTEKYSAQSKK